MCQWCGDPTCVDGEKCHHALKRNPLTNSNTFSAARRRIERATGSPVRMSPGAFWAGRRPGFVPGVRDAVVNPAGGPPVCSLCHQPIAPGQGQADHITPWREYTQNSAKAAMQEHGQSWSGGAIPEDFARVMSSDPRNLQPAHAACNQRKSDSTGAHRAGETRRRREEEERQEREERRRKEALRSQALREAWKATRPRDDPFRRRGRDPDPDPDGSGILA